jgi:DNA polymerase delta subunit 1
VIDAKAKFYTDPIATLDFMSLYPSIILANNFCFSTLVQNSKYYDIPGVEYVTIHVDDKTYVWAKGMTGVIPTMMRELLGARKAAKKLMAAAGKRIEELNLVLAETDDAKTLEEVRIELKRAEIEKAVYNARQLALKISANSIYGFTGAVKTGKYHCLAVADSVTYRAREMLHRTVDLVMQYTDSTCDVVYGDTDSIMVHFKDTHDAQSSADVAQNAAEWITEQFEKETGTNDIILEFEKVYWPYLLMRKKRYAGLMWEPNKQNKMVVTKLDAKGIELVRRDNCALAKRIQKKTLDALMYKRDVDIACKEIESELKLVVEDKIPVMDYKISKSRRKTYANEELPHLKVCEKMAKRQPGSEPQIGDRVPYVLLCVKHNPKAKTFEKAEDIGYVMRNPSLCKIDRLYYVEHQIENSICALMEHVITDPSSLFTWCKQQLNLQQNNQRTITSMLQPQLQSERADAESSAKDSKSRTFEDAMFGMSSAVPKIKRSKKSKF